MVATKFVCSVADWGWKTPELKQKALSHWKSYEVNKIMELAGSKGLFYCRQKKFSVLLQTFSFRTGKLYSEMLVNVPTSRARSYYQDYILHDFFSGCGITSRRISFLWLAFSAIKHAFGFKKFMKSLARSLSEVFRRQPSWSMNHRPPAGLVFSTLKEQLFIMLNYSAKTKLNIAIDFLSPSRVFFQAVFTLSGTPERGKLYTKKRGKKPTWVRKK